MNLRALVAVLGLAASCAVQPDLSDHPPSVEQVQPAAFQSVHGVYLKVVDDRSTYMQQLFDHVPIDKPDGITAEVDRWRTEGGALVTDRYLEARAPAVIEHYLASDPTLAVPPDRQLAFEQLDTNRWRTYLLLPTAEIDATSVAHAEASRDPNTDRPIVMLDFTPSAAQHFGELTARITGHKLAVLVNGTVVSAPVINAPITGGRAAVTFGATGDDAQAHAVADALDPAR